MMLVDHHIQPFLVGEQIFVETFIEEPRRDLRLAIAARQVRARGAVLRDHFVGDEGIRTFAHVPGLHLVPRRSFFFHKTLASRNRRMREAVSSDCSISGWCPAPPSPQSAHPE